MPMLGRVVVLATLVAVYVATVNAQESPSDGVQRWAMLLVKAGDSVPVMSEADGAVSFGVRIQNSGPNPLRIDDHCHGGCAGGV